ncbi:MAG: SURF1 family protein, partial [Candidatus Eisenbacteria bacterium]
AVSLALLVAGACISLGFWQLGRWHETRAANDRLRAALAAPPLPLAAGAAGLRLAAVRGGRVRIDGRYDESRQVVLVGRTRAGGPGVHVVTPLLPDDGGPAILVDRGFVPSPDAATARPGDVPEPGPRIVIGVVAPLERRPGDSLWRRAAGGNESLAVWSARWLDPDSVVAAFPYRVAPLYVRQLPGPGVPARPAREPARIADPTIHLSYAVQWFFFALIALIGPFILRRARLRRGGDVHPGGTP